MFTQATTTTRMIATAIKRVAASAICANSYQVRGNDWSMGRHSSTNFVSEQAVHRETPGDRV